MTYDDATEAHMAALLAAAPPPPPELIARAVRDFTETPAAATELDAAA